MLLGRRGWQEINKNRWKEIEINLIDSGKQWDKMDVGGMRCKETNRYKRRWKGIEGGGRR